MTRPSPVRWGPRPYQDRDRQLLDYIESIRPVQGIGTRVYDVPKGRAIDANPGSASGGSSASHPFQLIDASDRDSGGSITSVNIRVVYGTVAGAAPSGMSPGDEPIFVLSGLGNGPGYVWLGITRDTSTSAITSRFLDSGAAVPANTTTNGYREVGSWVVTDGTLNIAQTIIGSQEHNYCITHLWALS